MIHRRTSRLSREYQRGKYPCTIDLLFDCFGFVCFANKNRIVSRHKADSKPVQLEVNSTVILPPLVYPGLSFGAKLPAIFLSRWQSDSNSTQHKHIRHDNIQHNGTQQRTLRIRLLGVATFSIMTFSKTTFRITKHSIRTLGMTTFSINKTWQWHST